MCQFVSWKKHENKVYFLTNSDLETKEGKKLLKAEVIDDLCGHGVIESFYPELKGKGENLECTDFSTPKNFPKEIIKALKEGKLSRIGEALDILNKAGRAEYNKIKQSAWAEYLKIVQSARAEYDKIVQPAWAKYFKIKQSALAKYRKIEQSAWAKYLKIEQPARTEYDKIEQSAEAEYRKIEQSAEADYNETCALAFSKIVSQKKYRKDEWK